MFQVKIVHHILPAKGTLHKFGINALKSKQSTPICDLPQCSAVLDIYILQIGGTKKKIKINNIAITLSEAQIPYALTDTVPQCLGINLCIIISKYYIYTASKSEEDYFFDAFFVYP